MQAQSNHVNPIKAEYSFLLVPEQKNWRDSKHERDLTWEGGFPPLRWRRPGDENLRVATEN